jgi:endonuclease/exonuclease/phosphatase (EEP) superfamily protein YafD
LLTVHRPGPWWWRRIAVLGCLFVSALLVIGSVTAGASWGGPSAHDGTRVRMLQLNLCNSGLAGCFTGRSAAAATALIRDEAPDLVTLNEVCRDDMPVLERALAEVARGGATSWAFQAAHDRRTGDVVRCRDGQPYGIGLVTRRAPRAGDATGGIYPVQDSGNAEQRAWLCLDVVGFAACTTHLNNSDSAVARAQCDYLLDTAIPGVRARLGNAPVLLGGDLNLRVRHRVQPYDRHARHDRSPGAPGHPRARRASVGRVGRVGGSAAPRLSCSKRELPGGPLRMPDERHLEEGRP